MRRLLNKYEADSLTCARPRRWGRALPMPARLANNDEFLRGKSRQPARHPLERVRAGDFPRAIVLLFRAGADGFLKNWRERRGADVPQVWLLRTDGTMVPQIAEPFIFSQGTPGDHATDYQLYTFPKVPVHELASIVVSCHGRLYGHEIKKLGESAAASIPRSTQEPG